MTTDTAAGPAPGRHGGEAQALAYVEQAHREAGKVPDLPSNLAARPIRSVGVIGAGTMGGGIAMSMANAGIPVILVDQSAETLERGLARVRDTYAFSHKRGRLDADSMQARLALISGATDIDALAPVDLAIEAVFEEMSLKKRIFAHLDRVLPEKAILATNTSGLDIDEIATATARPASVVGAHFFSPAHVQKLLEVVRTRDTAPDVIATLMELGHRMGKVSVLARVYPGFIGNALFRQYVREAHFLVEEGALPHQVDAVMTRFGFPMGVFAVHDMAGNDVGWQMRKAQMATRPTDRRWNDLILELCDMGRFGQKAGRGWYRYEPGDRTPRRDPEIEQFIVERSARLGIDRRPVSDEEILKRCLYGMINEGVRLLDQGVALRPGDIDITFITGYGFPRQRGGPMYYGESVGIDAIRSDIERFHAEHGYWWKPATGLERLARSGGTFADLVAGA